MIKYIFKNITIDHKERICQKELELAENRFNRDTERLTNGDFDGCDEGVGYIFERNGHKRYDSKGWAKKVQEKLIKELS